MKKEYWLDKAEDLIENTAMHPREVMSQLWDKAQEEMKNEQDKMDFSEFVGKDYQNLCIFGNQGYLESYTHLEHIDITYSRIDEIRQKYDGTPDYEVIEAKDLKYGDVFIRDDIEEPKLEDFSIFLGTSKYDDIVVSYLVDIGGVEVPIPKISPSTRKVKRFKRE